MTRILFITSTRIGDAVLSSGLLDHLARTYPDARVTVACGPLAAPLFPHAPGVDEVIVMSKRAGGGHWIDLWRRTVTRRWDIVIDLRASATSWFLLAGKRHVKRKASGASAPVHKVEEAASVIGLSPPPAPTVWSSEAARAKAETLLGGEGAVLAIAPAAAAPFKEWPRERFAALAAHLTGPDGALAGARIAVFGGPGDEAAAREAVAGLDPDRVIDLTGKLAIDDAAACLEKASLFVGNDSGLMHLSAAAGTPTLGLFGPTDERLYGPWGRQARAIRAGGPADERERARLRFASESLMGDLELEPVIAAAESLIEEHVKR
ncbi:glycosyl transferase [Marinicauda pacifica]|uniref:Glycosyltransferase family 9 protein n=1 Tax=Marinicauda pacifica TaxID=1133559 RepID=A0A4S2HEF0_9PROT|nr:glycosyltransferase family 9 protein [Marinicauda pacifica]TGY94168.1 glycosyltransferase family 9 protein [Marinicauda pacifica]GGE33506.1 glycosyl transferase [Marinicauda pacifica]